MVGIYEYAVIIRRRHILLPCHAVEQTRHDILSRVVYLHQRVLTDGHPLNLRQQLYEVELLLQTRQHLRVFIIDGRRHRHPPVIQRYLAVRMVEDTTPHHRPCDAAVEAPVYERRERRAVRPCHDPVGISRHEHQLALQLGTEELLLALTLNVQRKVVAPHRPRQARATVAVIQTDTVYRIWYTSWHCMLSV